MGTVNTQEHEHMYNTTLGKEKCYNLDGHRNDKKKNKEV